MAEFSVSEAWEAVDEKYIGVRLNTGKVKPAHIANGLFRSLTGQTSDTKLLNQFVCFPPPKPGTNREQETNGILDELRQNKRVDRRITTDNLHELRRVIRSVLTADSTVFSGGMDSYSAGQLGFVSRDRIGQEAGEFAGSWLRTIRAPLAKVVKDSLNQSDDIVTLLCRPLLSGESEIREPSSLPTGLLKGPKTTHHMWKGLNEAADTLAKHMAGHPDKLFRLRQATLFSGVLVLRHIMSLEAHYLPEERDSLLPIVLDSAPPYSFHALRDASKRSLARAGQSLVRFYAWAFAEYLKEHYTKKELQKLSVPTYRNKVSDAATEIWQQAKSDAEDASQKFDVFGIALYDILAVEAGTTNPVSYFRALGRHVGLVNPHGGATSWFAPEQDITQLFLYCCIEPGEAVSMPELLRRLWDRFGVIVGGRSEDEKILMDEGITLWDRDLLRLNTTRYSENILQMDLASHLADGVLAIRLGGEN